MQATFDHFISLVRCGQGCSGIHKVFKKNKKNEQLIFPEIAVFRRVELY